MEDLAADGDWGVGSDGSIGNLFLAAGVKPRVPRLRSRDDRGWKTQMQPVATPFFFYFLSGLALLGGVLVITRRNPVHSALSLILTLLALAGLYLMLYAPFVAGVQ